MPNIFKMYKKSWPKNMNVLFDFQILTSDIIIIIIEFNNYNESKYLPKSVLHMKLFICLNLSTPVIIEYVKIGNCILTLKPNCQNLIRN